MSLGTFISQANGLLEKSHFVCYLFIQQMLVNSLLCAGHLPGSRDKTMIKTDLALQSPREDRLCVMKLLGVEKAGPSSQMIATE